jgi:hypothetical protein
MQRKCEMEPNVYGLRIPGVTVFQVAAGNLPSDIQRRVFQDRKPSPQELVFNTIQKGEHTLVPLFCCFNGSETDHGAVAANEGRGFCA